MNELSVVNWFSDRVQRCIAELGHLFLTEGLALLSEELGHQVFLDVAGVLRVQRPEGGQQVLMSCRQELLLEDYSERSWDWWGWQGCPYLDMTGRNLSMWIYPICSESSISLITSCSWLSLGQWPRDRMMVPILARNVSNRNTEGTHLSDIHSFVILVVKHFKCLHNFTVNLSRQNLSQ